MFKKNHFIILSGSKLRVNELHDLARDFKEHDSASFTSYEVLNDYTMILAYPNRQPPRLEDLRKFLMQYDDVVVSSFDSEEVVVMNHGNTKSIRP